MTKTSMPETAEMTELSLDDLEQVSAGHTPSHNDGVFYGLLGAGIAVVGGIILIGLLG